MYVGLWYTFNLTDVKDWYGILSFDLHVNLIQVLMHLICSVKFGIQSFLIAHMVYRRRTFPRILYDGEIWPVLSAVLYKQVGHDRSDLETLGISMYMYVAVRQTESGCDLYWRKRCAIAQSGVVMRQSSMIVRLPSNVALVKCDVTSYNINDLFSSNVTQESSVTRSALFLM